ncbi:2,3-bisphosphoglycerate-dependent phosphoglycerate mutase [Patescibacteria group bacterium]|nr:2,3-bisphosphoglycerate-dependent phosphoglycerate mutase [Patescibacteria group bacterium]
MSNLVLVRHGESKWNSIGVWTGLTDIGLTENGIQKARKDGEYLKGISFDIAFTSKLQRSTRSLDEIKDVLGIQDLETIENAALNERDYGDFTGKKKLEVKKKYGEKQFLRWRRGWNCPIPGGETLKDVYQRVSPYYEKRILPELKKGKNVLIVAHGNSLRALVKYLENIPEKEIPRLEIATGEIYIYQMDKNGKILNKQIKNP